MSNQGMSIEKADDDSYIVRTWEDDGKVYTAPNFGRVVKIAREYFGEMIVKGKENAEGAE